MARRLPCRTKQVTTEGATFTLGAPSHGQIRTYAEGMTAAEALTDAKERVKRKMDVLSKFVCDSLNDGDPALQLKPEQIDDEMDTTTFNFLYEEVLKYAGFEVKKDSSPSNPLPAASSTSSPTSEAA